MALDTLLLGPFEFTDFAVPDEMPLGGAQRLAVHKLIGGRRVVDVLGADPSDRRWTGKWWGPDAPGLAQELDALRVAGNPLPLSWGMEARIVVISNLVIRVEKFNLIWYDITCTVADNNEASAGAAATAETLVTNDLGSASSQGSDYPSINNLAEP